MKTFFISDTHFGHQKIIEYTSRKNLFSVDEVDKMNQLIIDNWNSVVSSEDTVYFLGDFALAPTETIIEIAGQLNGKITMIYGNHDRKGIGFFRKLFHEVSKKPIIIEDKYLLSHAPQEDFDPALINIHGHIHDGSFEKEGLRYYNVSVERHQYTPVNLDEIEEHFKDLS